MDKNILVRAEKIHMIGIGGTGMSGLAKLLLDMDKTVSGSDNNDSPVIQGLKKKGIRIFYPQKRENVNPKNAGLVIYSHAIFPDNPEYKKAVEYKIPLMSYPEAVGALMINGEKRGIAVAGTHGKTSTSALISSVLRKAGYSPSFLLGGEIRGIGNSCVGKSDFLVVEACEYKRSFLNYKPEVAVLTSIENDHLDYYRDISEIKGAFKDFLCNVKEKRGLIIYCADDKNVSSVIKKVKNGQFISYGMEKGILKAKNIRFIKGYPEFECFFRGKKLGKVKPCAPGEHNVLNSLAAIACARHLGVSWEKITEGLSSFKGVHRRCEILGSARGITVLDDYAHHPSEIKYTLDCIRNMFLKARIIVVFQPHQYSRTRFMLKEFAMSFSKADKVVVPDIYFVRDSIMEKKLVNAQMLVEKVRQNGGEALYLPTFKEIIEYLNEISRPGDVVITVGAGPVNSVAEGFLNKLRQRE